MIAPAPADVRNFVQRGAGGFANLALPSGEGVFISVATSGFRLHRLILWGRLPGRSLFVADIRTQDRIVAVLARDIARLPKLPASAELQAFLVTATAAISNPDTYRSNPHDEAGEATTTLAVLTRAALAEPDTAALVRRYQRAAATA